ncbi:MAG: winged helix-turn-helix domain-containing protein [Methanobacteriota archaeon]
MRNVETGKPGPLPSEIVVAALSDAYARRVLAVCVKKAKAVKDVSHETGMPLPTTYRHVNDLVEKGLLVVERSALTEDGKRYELYRSRIRYARLELDASGERVVWEPNEPVEDRLARMWLDLRERR